MNIERVNVDWYTGSLRRPEVWISVRDSFPKINQFVFTKKVINDQRVAYCGQHGFYRTYFYQDLTFINDVYKKPLILNMADGTSAIVHGPWVWHAKEMNAYFDLAMDVYINTPDQHSIHRAVTLAGAKIIAKRAGIDLARVTKKLFGPVKQQVTLEPIEKTASETGTYNNYYWEKINLD